MPSITIRTDQTARDRAAALLPMVQVTDPAYTIDDVYSGAARIGMTRITSTQPGRAVVAADLATRAGTGVADTTFDLAADLDTLAGSRATGLGLPKAQVVGAAVILGLSLLSGVDPGPYTADGASRQIAQPFA